MNTKLTLSLDETVIRKAKFYAREKSTSVSELVENYLRAVTSDMEVNEIEISPLVNSLKGSFTAPEEFDYKEVLADELITKHL